MLGGDGWMLLCPDMQGALDVHALSGHPLHVVGTNRELQELLTPISP